MKFSDGNSIVKFDVDTSPEDSLRNHERLFNWKAEPWNFSLLKTLKPEQVYGFFGQAKLRGETLYLDGNSPRGKMAFDWIKQHFRSQVYNALGNIEICKAKDGEIISSFFTGSPQGREYCTKDEIELMYSLGKRGMRGEKINAMQELETYRGSKL